MVYLVVGIVIALLVYAVAKAATGNRYANMTGEQFEREAKRSSKIGAAVTEFQKIVDPGHRVVYAERQALRIEADAAESGDRPQTGPPGRQDDAAHSELERKIIEEG
jgi:hypothetical protein